MDQALDSFLNLNEHAEVRHRTDLAVNPGVQRITLRHRIPWIGRQLLDAEADALVLDVDSEHSRFELVALLDHLARMPNFLGPRQIRNVHEPVDARLDLDEHAEVGDRLDLALHLAADRMLEAELFPRIRFGLLESERYSAIRLVNAEHLHLNHVA